MRMVALDGYTVNPGDNSWEPVAQLGDLVVFDTTLPEQVLERSLDAEALLTNKVAITAELISQLPTLKYIAVTATGYDAVDVKSARERNIPVSNIPEYSTRSVAQHVFSMLLSQIHQPLAHDQAIRTGVWQERNDFSFWLKTPFDLEGQTMGIIGLGRIGRAVADLAVAFGMRVLFHNRSPKIDIPRTMQPCSLDDLLSQSDFVSLNCPQTPETVGIVNRAFLDKMKPTATLVNASRGALVVEKELADALNHGRIAAACLDVFSQEPINSENPLLKAQNCLMTPHMAWASIDARKRLVQITAANIRSFIDGSPANIVN